MPLIKTNNVAFNILVMQQNCQSPCYKRGEQMKNMSRYVYKTLLFPLVFVEHLYYLEIYYLAPLSFILLFSKQITIRLISNTVSRIYHCLHFIEGVPYIQNWDDLVHDSYGNTDHFCSHISGYHPASFPFITSRCLNTIS